MTTETTGRFMQSTKREHIASRSSESIRASIRVLEVCLNDPSYASCRAEYEHELRLYRMELAARSEDPNRSDA